MLALDALIIQTIALEAGSSSVVASHHMKTILAMPDQRVTQVLRFLIPFLKPVEKQNVCDKVKTLVALEDRPLPVWLDLFENSKTCAL